MNRKKKVSLVRYSGSSGDLSKALEFCGGLDGLKSGDHVFIKPNLVAWDNEFPICPYGVYTSTRLVEDLVILLKQHGVSRITIGEGSVEISPDCGTAAAFEGLGYHNLAKKYGVLLCDLNKSRSLSFEPEAGLKLKLARDALENDFFINFPVLKTHGQTKVSLGIKNLKGCLKTESKKMCHSTALDLEYCFSFLPDIIKPDLTIIDGIYALERGALHFGKAHRKDIIIASASIAAADITGAACMGYLPSEIKHIVHYTERNGIDTESGSFEICGESMETHSRRIEWDWAWNSTNTGPAAFEKTGISGPSLPKYDGTLCSGCSTYANMCNILVMSAFKGHKLPAVEILNGKKMQASAGYDKTVLLGNCIIKANKNNPHIREAVEARGCPPPRDKVVESLKKAGLDVDESYYSGYLKQQSGKYDGKDGYDRSLYSSSD